MAEKKSTQKKAAKPAASSKPASKTAAKADTAKKPAAAKASASRQTVSAPKSASGAAAKKAAVSAPSAKDKAAAKAEPAKTAAKSTPPHAATAKTAATVKSAEKTAAKPVAAKTEKAGGPAAVEKKPVVAAATTAAKSAEKPKTAAKQKKAKTSKSESSGGGFKARVVALTQNKKLMYIIAAALAFVLTLSLVLGIVFGVKGCKKSDFYDGKLAGKLTIAKPNDNSFNEGSTIKPSAAYADISAGVEHFYGDNEIKSYAYNAKYTTNTEVGYSGKVIGTVDRNIPSVTRDEGLGAYPKYGYTLKTVIGTSAEAQAARDALIAESSYLAAFGTHGANRGGEITADKYTWIDENGFLFRGSRAEPVEATDKSGKQRRLYKHSASVGLYMGDVSDDEPGIIKEVTLRNRYYSSYSVTGVYAPAGEVIKIQLSDKDMNATGGIVIHIGQALYNGQANNIWTSKNQMQRIPHVLTTLTVDKTTAVYDEESGYWTAYVGSFLGGPLYIRNETATFTARISGGVAYRHFILGYTSEEEFAETSKSSAPYFDLEVWHLGVLHSGPATYAKSLNYEKLYNAAVLWDKVSTVTTTNGAKQGIVFIYDPFVAAGAAVAFPGRMSVNCPTGWMSSSLNYDALVTSGSWGNFHEYHHNFQNFGIGYTGEVTNNALNLVSYSLFTKISASRQLASYGCAGLSGWNRYTSASWALNQVNNGSIGDTNGLAVYATLMHNFGQDAFIKARGTSGVNYLNKWAELTHQDFTCFASQLGAYTGEIIVPAATNYPTFVPVSSVYQTGRSYIYDNEKRDIETMQPFVIPHGTAYTVDLRPYKVNDSGQYESGSVVIGNGFKYTVKSVDTSGLKGNATFVPTGETGVYTFNPDTANMISGKIRVTLSITTSDNNTTHNGKALNDVDLILEFQQSHETNKTTLERTVYTYSSNVYTDAVTAYENGFAGYTDKLDKIAHSNPTQNCNTDIWLYPDTAENRAKYPNAPEHYFVRDNRIDVVDGKLYIAEDGKYRVYLRGRLNCALYYSLDGRNYTLGATIKDTTAPKNSAQFRPNDPNTYFDLELKAGSWIYIREVLIVQSTPTVSYIGVGLAQWTVPMYTTTTDEDGTTHYWNASGKEVSAEEASNTDPVPPTNASYVNAYKSSYQFPDNSSYKTDYFYTRSYSCSYTGEPKHSSTWDEGVKILSCNKQPWDNTTKIDNLLIEGQDTFFHTNNASNSSKGPMILELDMGKEISANCVTFYGRTTAAATTAHQGLPREFTVEISTDGATYTSAGTYTNKTGGAYSATVDLDATYNFRYVRLTINSTHSNNGHFILSGIRFTDVFKLAGVNNLIAPDFATYSQSFGCVQTNSTFGHAYLGKATDTVSFTFKGTRLAILNTTAYGKNYKVLIDGIEINSIELAQITGPYGIGYLSPQLSSGTHSVVIVCTGEACFDSFAVYNEG